MKRVHLDPLCEAETPLVRARRRDPSQAHEKTWDDGGGGFARSGRLASRPLSYPGSTGFRDCRDLEISERGGCVSNIGPRLTAAAYGEFNAFANNIGLATRGRPDDPPLLEARAISRRFGHVRALDGADFAVHAGEICALIGDNGAGKSTLVKILSGADRPDEGQILVAGKPVAFNSPNDRAGSGHRDSLSGSRSRRRSAPFENFFLGREDRPPGLLGQLGFVNRPRCAGRRRTIRALGVRLRLARDSGVVPLRRVSVSRSRSRAPRCGRTASSSWTSPRRPWASCKLDACST